MSGFGFKQWKKTSGETVIHKLNKPRTIDKDKARSYLKLFVIGLFLIFITGVTYYSPLFHTYVYGPSSSHIVKDPNTIIWQSTNPSGDGSEFKTSGFVYQTNCKGTINCLQAGTGSIQSISQSTVDDFQLAQAVGNGYGQGSIQVNPTAFVTQIKLTLSKVGSPVGHAIVKIFNDANTVPCATGSSQITGSSIASSSLLDISTLPTSTPGNSITFTFSGVNQVSLSSSKCYAFVLIINDATTINGSNYVQQEGCAAECGATGSGALLSTCTPPPTCTVSGADDLDFWEIDGSSSLTNTVPAVAITRSQVGDLSVANSKTLGLNFSWVNPTWVTGGTFGMFLTVNATLPNTSNWNPVNDTSVIYLYNMTCSVSCNTTVSNYLTSLSFLRTFAHGESIQSESPTGVLNNGCGGSSPCFISGGPQLSGNPTSIFNYAMQLLNYTGTTQSSSTCSFSGGLFSGSGCSWSNLGNTTVTRVNTRQHLPFLTLNTPVYLGFYELTPSSGSVEFGFSNLDIYTYNTGVAVAVPPSIDTGGFFGPVIKALINIGVWMLQQIVFNFGVFVTILVTVLNGIGNFFGIGNVGTDVVSLFTDIGNILGGIFSGVINLFSGAVSFLTQGITSTLSFIQSTLYTTFVINFLINIGLFVTNVISVWNDFISLFVTAGQALNYLFFLYYCVGLMEVYFSGLKGFKDWLELGEMITLLPFKLSYWFLEEARALIVFVKKMTGAPVVTA